LRLHGIREDMCVADPFMGLGSTGLAAKLCGAARFLGFETDPDYFDHAQRSLMTP
jgi:DNA modification methylase